MRTVDKSVNSPVGAGGRQWRNAEGHHTVWEQDSKKGTVMIVNLARPEGDGVVMEQIDVPVDFEGSGAQPGVLVTFPLDGGEVTGRIIRVDAAAADAPDGELAIDVELVDRAALDAASEVTLARLPPKDDFRTDI